MTKLFYMILAFYDKKADKNNTILDLATTFNARPRPGETNGNHQET